MGKSWRIASIVLFLLATTVGSVLGDNILALSDTARANLRRFTELMEVAHARYGGEVTYRSLVFASLQGMLRQLDPHTSFLPPEIYARMRERQQSSFYGLGILVGMRNDQLTVITPIEGTPASRQGLRAGDVISTIEGEPTRSMTLDEAVQKLKGPKDTQVHITIARAGLSAPLEMSITRAEIPLNTVRYAYLLDDVTGYFRITDFSRSTGREVAEALDSLKDQGMKRLILDLRNNGGGLLDQAIEVADQFVPEGSTIVETRGRVRESFQRFTTSGSRQPIGIPLVVLVNGGSASAAEIVAGAIQDHDVGVIVGTPTWGKGLVQTVYSLSYDSALALTTAKYYTPSGRLIQRDYTSYYDYYTRNHPSPGNGEVIADPGEEQVFFTDQGRRVYGGGGITPDVTVDGQDTPTLLQFLVAHNSFFNFGVEYTNRNPVASEEWEPGAQVLEEFVRWLIDDGVVSEEEAQEVFDEPATRSEVLYRIRAEVFNSAFGNEAWYRVLAHNDNQIQAAMEQFGRAQDLLAGRPGPDPGDVVAKAAELTSG